ncbi:TonB-dependent siderophore receptor [Methylomonas sp. BW4-1]|uniref:TonB-dependent receptor n=1 Tax=Methylomonas defluvii TaxID=3045149 RepID=A0ABU4UCM0_9GAMM|nr:MULTISPECIES: TonB-dependent receptor [unclassified Methylomonas]MDX8127074.1 TonB-dependent receptor [Methylomonas sp. OY6]QSB01132.1 TonB-dependent receptor [Methylomonas sp. EFPC1]
MALKQTFSGGLFGHASALVLGAVLAVSGTAAADSVSRAFSIPAGSLSTALNRLAESGGLQLVYDTAITEGLQSKGLSGHYTPEAALQRLLADSGLSYRMAENGNIVIERQSLNYKQDPTALPAVNVVGKKVYDPNDPFSQFYAVPNASTATKTDIAIMDTPVSIQVVPKSIMNDQQAIRIEDALTQNVSGVQRAYGTADMYESFIIRGFASDDQMYRNGFRRSMGKFDPANIEQLEVLKGPASVLYGRLQPGGMVNYVTKKALDVPYYSLQQQFGSFSEFRTTVDATGPLDKDKTLLYRFNAAYDEGNSFRDFVDHERVFIAPKLTWRPNDRFEANVEIEKRHENYTEDYGVPVSGNRPITNRRSLFTGDPAIKPSQDTTLIYADWSFKFNDDWGLRHKFQWDETDIVFGGVAPNSKINADGHTLDRFGILGTSNRRSYSTSLDLTGKFQTFGLKHNVLVGGDWFFFNQDAPDNNFSYGTIPTFDINNPQYGNFDMAALRAEPANWFWRSRDDWYGVYFQDQITLWDKLHIMGGGRYDMAGYGGYGGTSWDETKAGFSMQHEDKFSPRVGIVYQPWDWLSVYGNYVESFGTNNGRSATGGNFAPQAAEQYEIGFKTEFFDKRLSSTVAYYHLTKNNLMTFDLSTPDPTDQKTIGEARSQGIEVDIKGQITDEFSLVTTYAYTDARYTKDYSGLQGNRLLNVPEHQASLWGTYQFTEHFKAGLGGVVVGKREGDNTNTYQLPGYTRLDAMMAYVQPIGKTRLTAQVNVYNLLDKEYYTGSTSWLPTANVGAPISAMGSLKLEY